MDVEIGRGSDGLEVVGRHLIELFTGGDRREVIENEVISAAHKLLMSVKLGEVAYTNAV